MQAVPSATFEHAFGLNGQARLPPAWPGLAAIARYDRSAVVGRISMPVALFAAGRDEVPPPSVISKLAHACRTPS
jgi:hypothetical protein